MTTFTRTPVALLRPGNHPDGAVWIEVDRTEKGALAFTGVIGPKRNGNASGSCGQIVDYLADVEPGPGWTRASVDRLAELWARWHFADARAGCEHQRAGIAIDDDDPYAGTPWDKRPIDPEHPTNTYREWIPGRGASWNMLGWVRPDEHDDGLLTRPCPECDYRYGSQWLTEDTPAEVFEEIQAMPGADPERYPWNPNR